MITTLTAEEQERRAYADGRVELAELLRETPINDESPNYQAGYAAGYDAGTRDAEDDDGGYGGYDAGYRDGVADTKAEQEEKT